MHAPIFELPGNSINYSIILVLQIYLSLVNDEVLFRETGAFCQVAIRNALLRFIPIDHLQVYVRELIYHSVENIINHGIVAITKPVNA